MSIDPAPRGAAPAPGRIPGPRGLAALSAFRGFQRDPLHAILEAQRDHGDLYAIDIGVFPRYIMVCSPELARNVLVDNATNYVKSPGLDGLRFVFSTSSFVAEGEEWRRKRRISQPAFRRDRLEHMVGTFARRTARWLDGVVGTGDRDIHRDMSELTLGILGEAVLGVDLSGEAAALMPALKEIYHFANRESDAIVRRPLWLPLPSNRRLKAAIATIHEIARRAITQHRARSHASPDLLSMLLESRDDDKRGRLSDAEILDEVTTHLIAGHETSAATASFALHTLAMHPEVAARAAAEATAVLGDRLATAEDLPRLPMTGRVIQEVLRLYPPAWIVERTPLQPETLGGWPVPMGAYVGICPWAIHHNPRIWPDPERFDPDRFLPEAMAGRDRLALMAFGAGPRTCIGERFALMELTVILAMTLARARPVPTPGRSLLLDPSVTLRPRDGAWIRLDPHASSPSAPT